MMVKGSPYEREFKEILEREGFYVIPSADSRAVDLIGIKKLNDHCITCLVEVKSYKTKRYDPTKSKKAMDQWREMKNLETYFWNGPVADQQIIVVYALHKKNTQVPENWIIAQPLTLDDPRYHFSLEVFLEAMRP